jgi:hypothetical protein
MDRIGLAADYSSGLAHGFTAVMASTATLTIAMILITVTTDRYQSVGSSRSIISMRTRRAMDRVMSGMQGMRVAANTAPDLRADTVAADMVVAVAASAWFSGRLAGFKLSGGS